MITYQAKAHDPQAELLRADAQGMGTLEFMGRTFAHTFGSFNSIGQSLREEDFAAHGSLWDMHQALGIFDDDVQTDPQALREYAENSEVSREDFNKTREEGGEDLSRGGRIAWFAGMTKTRARLQALELDRRDREALILAQNTDSPLRAAAGFGAAMMAVMLDPINLIPVGGAATKGMRAAQRMATTAKAGVKGALIADAFLLPRAAAMGEDVGPETAFLDTIFGAAFGAGLGGMGAIWHARKRGKLTKNAADFLNELTEAGIAPAEAKRIAERYYDVAADLRGADAEQLDVLRETAFGSRADRETLNGLRRTLSLEERQKFGLLMDRAVAALAHGEKMDVGRWAEELGIKAKIEETFREALLRRAEEFQRQGERLASRERGESTGGTEGELAAQGEGRGMAAEESPLAPRGEEIRRDGVLPEGAGTAAEARTGAELAEGLRDIAPDFRTAREEIPASEALGARGGEENKFLPRSEDGRGETVSSKGAGKSENGAGTSEAAAAFDPMERAYAQMEAEGSVAPEDLAAVTEARADVERAKRLEEAALDVFECALNI